MPYFELACLYNGMSFFFKFNGFSNLVLHPLFFMASRSVTYKIFWGNQIYTYENYVSYSVVAIQFFQSDANISLEELKAKLYEIVELSPSMFNLRLSAQI